MEESATRAGLEAAAAAILRRNGEKLLEVGLDEAKVRLWCPRLRACRVFQRSAYHTCLLSIELLFAQFTRYRNRTKVSFLITPTTVPYDSSLSRSIVSKPSRLVWAACVQVLSCSGLLAYNHLHKY